MTNFLQLCIYHTRVFERFTDLFSFLFRTHDFTERFEILFYRSLTSDFGKRIFELCFIITKGKGFSGKGARFGIHTRFSPRTIFRSH
jgi:ribosomal protein L3